MQSRYQQELILRDWEERSLTPRDCYETVEDDDPNVDDEVEERWFQKMREGDL